MVVNGEGDQQVITNPHVVLIPSAGMGHLLPFSRFAASLSAFCEVTMVAILPTVSSAESRHYSDILSSYPCIHPVRFELPPFDSSSANYNYPNNSDPFHLRFERINQSAHDLMNYVLTEVPKPVSALVVDITLTTSFAPLAKSLGIPCYVLFTASAAMLAFCAYFPTYHDSNPDSVIGDIEIPGLRTVPAKSVPRALHDPKHVFTRLFITNGRNLVHSDGILVNTFDSFEKDTLVALRQRKHSQPGLPAVIPIGPLQPVRNIVTEPGAREVIPWLNKQPEKSVVYVSFGSRTAMRAEQMKELGLGLEASGCRFVWVVKQSVVDTHDKAGLEELLGEGFLERVKDRGMVVKGWVEQEEVLRHRAVGGFLSHCGWNSVTEAAQHGVKVLAWPRGGDQRINAGAVVRSGLGVWVEEWSWEGEEGLVGAADIGRSIKEMMADDRLTATAKEVGDRARNSVAPGGSSYEGLTELVRKLNGVK